MSLCLPNGKKVPIRPCFSLPLQTFDGIRSFWWLYENSKCVGYDVQFADGSRQVYDASGCHVPHKAAYFVNRYVKHYAVWLPQTHQQTVIHDQWTTFYRRTPFGNYILQYTGWSSFSGFYNECDDCCFYSVENDTSHRRRVVTFQWKFALLRFRHILRVRARRRIAKTVSDACMVNADVASVIATFVV